MQNHSSSQNFWVIGMTKNKNILLKNDFPGIIALRGVPISQEKKCPEFSTWIAAHTEGPAWFVMCNMCVMMTEI